jgi:hypothetical protein
VRNSLPSLEGGGVQARIVGARGTLADHEPIRWLTTEPCVIRQRSWICVHNGTCTVFSGKRLQRGGGRTNSNL